MSYVKVMVGGPSESSIGRVSGSAVNSHVFVRVGECYTFIKPKNCS